MRSVLNSFCFRPQIQYLFREEYGEVYTVSVPTRQERIDFFQDLILKQAAEAPPSRRKACMCLSLLCLKPVRLKTKPKAF